jgi:hypothetical protein
MRKTDLWSLSMSLVRVKHRKKRIRSIKTLPCQHEYPSYETTWNSNDSLPTVYRDRMCLEGIVA